MSSTRRTLHYRRLRAPLEHGQSLIDPPLDQVGALLAENAAALQNDVAVGSRTLIDLRRQSRSTLIDAALQYTQSYRDVNLPASWRELPIALSGHQPQLFHTGVWFKNFALGALVREETATAIHLLIDNDTLNSPSIPVPSGSIAEPRVESIPLDTPGKAVPWEDRAVIDRDVFASFGGRVASTIEPFVGQPLIRELWRFAVDAAHAGANLGESLSQARHRLEAAWGLNTLELPLSKVCEIESFHWFTHFLLVELTRFHQIYNEALWEYRRVNRVRSKSHPVPELIADADGWLEAPFWIWQRGQPRCRLFARPAATRIELSDRDRIHVTVASADELGALPEAGIVVRPRALITTMFARLVLSDLFFHGIGGAKYDQLTDELIRRFFGCQPPAFVTLTATARLPLALPSVGGEDLRRVDKTLRELRFHPECHVASELQSSNLEAARLVDQKRTWIENKPPRESGHLRHEGIVAANEGLQKFVEPKRRELLDERRKLAAQLRNRRMLGSREFGFCLFPEETLRPLLLELSLP